MRTLSDLQKRILQAEFPDMHFESDTDVERYFELRKIGRQGEALALYNTRLRRKYPDDTQRTLIMRYYRSNDSRYHDLLRDNMVNLAERVVARTTEIITLLTREIDSVNMSDAYSVIRHTEGLLSIISPDRYAAIAFTEKYVRYAKLLEYRHSQMERTAELIRQYVTDTVESVQVMKKEQADLRRQRIRQTESRRQARPNFDLSAIRFSPADIARIVLPKSIVRTEDLVIAYCIRYWNLVNDIAFEKTIFLYSRKYKTRHSDIFLSIKNGRSHGWKDEEILNAVLANVVSGYYYSIRGDLYLQRTWAYYKQTIENKTLTTPTAILVPPTSISRQAMVKPARLRSKSNSIQQPKDKIRHEKAPRVKTLRAPEKRRMQSPKPVTPFKHNPDTIRIKKPPMPQAPVFVPNSVADIIRKLTGKSYTVYKELFFKGIRPSIRAVLASSSVKKGMLFGNRQNAAEEIVYAFLFEHYNDPYQNWNESDARKRLEGLGYAIPTLEPVIESWVRENA